MKIPPRIQKAFDGVRLITGFIIVLGITAAALLLSVLILFNPPNLKEIDPLDTLEPTAPTAVVIVLGIAFGFNVIVLFLAGYIKIKIDESGQASFI